MQEAEHILDRMPTDEEIIGFQKYLKERHDEELGFTDAKQRYLRFLNLFWILSQKPPKGDPPYDPGLPPWL